jgi:ergothioneine biosynthesis protein EgtB
MTLPDRYLDVRHRSEELCRSLPVEDMQVQAAEFASPAKWHLAHTTWFFEQFVLDRFAAPYRPFDEDFNFLFNSYYEGAGKRHARPLRGLLTRPSVARVLDYREAVNEAMTALLAKRDEKALVDLVVLGLHHEQQHQELLITDLKYALGTQPTHPAYDGPVDDASPVGEGRWIELDEGPVEIGHVGDGFCFDNELPRHRTWVHACEVNTTLVSNREWLEFVEDGGYRDHRHWHMDGWTWVRKHDIEAPLYWRRRDGVWWQYTLRRGLAPLDPGDAVMHVSFYEAAAFASWRGMQLVTEARWESVRGELVHGGRWEWTGSAYLPYPGYRPAPGVVGEYNGKFMVNQMVLRGGSVATPSGHARPTYRNFFYPEQRWQLTGLRGCR